MPSADHLDAARPVRDGEALDLARLTPYLQDALGLPGAPLELLQFPGGHSNLTYLVRIGGRELVLRRPPFGVEVKTAHDMDREWAILTRLAPIYPLAPRPVLRGDEAVLGARFYLMERVPGVVLRSRLPPGLELGPALARRLSAAAADTLADLHRLDLQATGLAELGRPDGYVQRQVDGWSRRYLAAQTDDLPAMAAVAAWLAANLPPPAAPALIHNDFKYDNLVLDPADLAVVRGVLDWEMATIGDPRMDLGTALCYWVEAGDRAPVRAFAFGPTTLPGSFTRREFAERWAERAGRSLDRLEFFHAFGLFKTAVVAQQIYVRFVRGHTRDPRFAAMIDGVRALAAQAVEVAGL
jgi:aminoglycoside phosphotransferase (APT) family kinase protein